MAAVKVSHLSYAYGKHEVLHDLGLAIPEGALYALLGPNGAGKTTLLQLLLGLRRAASGHIAVLRTDIDVLTPAQRARIGYVAEGQELPRWMRLPQLEAYLAPLYPTWDRALAAELRARFELPTDRKLGSFSRGERMKAALLCALAPRPKLLLMDEPFTGMDAVVKDDLVRGLLATAGDEGWTVVIASHDMGELELLADWVGLLADGRLPVSEPMETLRARFRRVTVVGDVAGARPDARERWLAVERGGRRLRFVIDDATPETEARLAARFHGAESVELEPLSLREIFVALTRARRTVVHEEEVTA